MARKGHHLSPQARARISAKLRGRHHSGHLTRHAGAHHGGNRKGGHHGPLSAATKAKISAALKAYYAAHPRAHHATKHSTEHRSISHRIRKPHPHKGGHRGVTHPRVSKTGRHHAAKGHALHPRKTSTHPRGHSTHHTSAHHRLAGQHHTIHHHRLRHGVVIHHRRPPGAAGPHHGRRHVRPALISARTRHKRTGYLRPKRAVHATYKIRVRRKPRTHRVWSRHR